MTRWAFNRADAPLLITEEQAGVEVRTGARRRFIRRLRQTRDFASSLSLRCPQEEFGVRSGRDGGLSTRTLLGNDSFTVPTQPAVRQQDTIAAVQATMTTTRTRPSDRLALQLAALVRLLSCARARPGGEVFKQMLFHFPHPAHKGPNHRPNTLAALTKHHSASSIHATGSFTLGFLAGTLKPQTVC